MAINPEHNELQNKIALSGGEGGISLPTLNAFPAWGGEGRGGGGGEGVGVNDRPTLHAIFEHTDTM